MVKIIIAAAILYYLNLDWWWIGLLIASALDLYNLGVDNINSARTVDKLNQLLYLLKKKNDDFEDKE